MTVLRRFKLIGWALCAVLAAEPAIGADDQPKIELSPDALVNMIQNSRPSFEERR